MAMNVQYKWQLQIDKDTYEVHPVYKDDMALDYEQETGQQFFRRKLSGKMAFVGSEAELIIGAPYDTEFVLVLQAGGDGLTYRDYYTSHFYMTDCAFNLDDKKVTVQPQVKDRYNGILDGMENEYNLVKLGCERTKMSYYERPLFQYYRELDDNVTCISGNMTFQQSANACLMSYAEDRLFEPYKAWITFDFMTDIAGLWQTFIARDGTPQADNGMGTYYLELVFGEKGQLATMYPVTDVYVRLVADDSMVLHAENTLGGTLPDYLLFRGYGGYPNIGCNIDTFNIGGRFICDVPQIVFGSGYTLVMASRPEGDFVDKNANYNYYHPAIVNWIHTSRRTTSDVTEYGQNERGEYFLPPVTPAGVHRNYFPICQESWRNISFWVAFDYDLDPQHETSYLEAQDWEWLGKKEVILPDAYKLSSVLKKLLLQVAPTVTFGEGTAYSEFLYGQTEWNVGEVMMTPKSNICKGEYQMAAQKAPMTLQTVFNMLKNVFQCYWFIDDSNRLRIEHISWFKNGGSYTSQHTISYDLTTLRNVRNGKTWAFATSSYEFKKEEMPERYEFAFMDECSYLFAKSPLVVKSSLVQKDKKEDVNISNFTSDLDFITQQPSEVSQDGYVLFCADKLQLGQYFKYIVWIDYVTIPNDPKVYIVNNYGVSLFYIQKEYWKNNLPAYDFEYYGIEAEADDIKFGKQQKLKFPIRADFSLQDIDPNTFALIRTEIGDGHIDKISINLSSRTANVTLNYRTYDNE